MKTVSLFLCFLAVASAFGQGSRPPVTTLNGLTDVTITSPANGQSLFYNSGTSQWTNGPAPAASLATLSDVTLSSPSTNQVLRWDSGSAKWINYGPLAFTDITGNISPAQANSGAGADATTFWRGDGTWGKPATGAIPLTFNLLKGDNSGNAMTSGFTDTIPVGHASYGNAINSTVEFIVFNGANTANEVQQFSLQTAAGTAKFAKAGAFTSTGAVTPLQNASDAVLLSDNTGVGNLLFVSDNNFIFGKHATATERVRINNGIMAGLTTDKGNGTINVSGGYYVNGNKIGGVATITATVDQTSTSETAHVTFTVPSSTVQIGTTFRVSAWGNIDNPTSAITYTPRIRWGGTGGVQLIAAPAITSTTSTRNNADWEVTGRVTIRTLGVSGTAIAAIQRGEHTSSLTSAYLTDMATSGATPVTIDTTINKDIVLTWTLSSPSGTPHVRSFGGVIEIVEP